MRKLAFLLIACCTLFTSFAQEQKKLKVGLVLSGGGAKGFAHIGVLKVLEEAGVEISYIGGTSMGAIVGGLYASGYNASQIDSIFHATDFDALLQDYIPRSSKNFYAKRNDELYAISLPFHKFKFGIPTAYSKGLYNYNLLTKLTHNVRNVRDFNTLPIPFLCMATDIETGEEVLLNKGYLPQAMLASAAFPSLFSPVEINGRWLVDGGVTNNYPIEEVRALGADFIIGVDVQDDLKDRKALQDATRILVQISNMQMNQKMKEKIASTDIYIKPDITSFNVISFSNGRQIIAEGEKAAYKFYDKIEELATLTGKYQHQRVNLASDTIQVANININKLDNFTRAYVLGKLRFKPNQRIHYDDLKVGIDNLTATQNFSAISYSIEEHPDGDALNLNLTESNIQTYLKFSLHYDGLFKSGILTNLTQKKLFFKNDIASVDIVLGDNFRYNFDYYVDNGFYFSYGLRSRYNRFTRNVATDFSHGAILEDTGTRTLNIDFSDFTNQAYLQTIFIQKFIVGAGLEHKHLKIKSETLETTSPVLENSDYLSAFGYMKFDSFDNKYFPKRGWYFSGEFQTYLSSTDHTNTFRRFSITHGELGIATTFFKRATLKWETEGGFAIGPESVPFFDFILGGYGFSPLNNIRQFYGYDFLSISGDSYIKTAVTFDYEIFRKNHVNIGANFANIKDNLFEAVDWFTNPGYTGYAIGYGIETVIGPVEVKYSWSPELPKGFVWFSVGFWF
ncbi:MAG TPA: patatin-like phospholipase family protein [Flavobacterium sp.]|jgi:NTE family protein